MNQRERHAPGGVAIAAPPEADSSPPISRPPSEPPASLTLVWEQFIDRLSPELQRHLMNLANTHGLVLTSQLPDLASAQPGTDGRPRTLTQLLTFEPNSLAPLPLLGPAARASGLDGDQAEVVRLALDNPDLLLVQCLPRTGKAAVVREILTQAISRKWRVLYLATSLTVDRLLQDYPEDGPARLRCLARDERADRLPAPVASLTLGQREKTIHQTALQRSQRNLQTAQEYDTRLRELEAACAELAEVNTQLPVVRQRVEDLTARSESLRGEIEALAQAASDSGEPEVARKLRELRQWSESRCCDKVAERSRLHEECQQYEQELNEARSQVDQVRTLCEAKQGGRWWSASFWKAKFDKSLPEKSVHLEEVKRHIEEAIQAAKARIAVLDAEIDAVHRERDGGIRTLLDDELGRRTAEMRGELDRACAEEASLVANLERNRNQIASTLELTPERVASLPVEELRSMASSRQRENEQELLFARRWNDFLQSEGEGLVRQNRVAIPLVAGTFGSVQADAFFTDAAVRSLPFDLLLIDEAAHLQEGDFNAAIARAKRTVLISEVGEPDTDAERAGRNAKGASRYSVAPRRKPDVFEKLWKRFFTPIWTYEGKRLVAHLVPLAEDQLRYVERESVADNPQVELRIHTPDQGEPRLSGVAFAPSMTPAQAHRFLYSELGEVMAFPPSRVVNWSEGEASIHVRFGDLPILEEVSLDEGVRQQLNGYYTIGFVFDPTVWTRDRASEWLGERLASHSPGKAIRLEIPSRIDPPYAQWLNDLFRIGYRVSGKDATTPVVRFVKVPEKPAIRELPNHPSGDRRPVAPRLSGAGLEIDLADTRRRSELPPDWLSALPNQGLVNRAEAEALIQLLPSVRREYPDRSIAVSSLYPAQLTLLRYLLRKMGFEAEVQVIDPYRLDPEGCDVLLLSLTRSHVSRAVTFGDHPRTIQQLLTHVRTSLYLLGDMGTISRRASWEGACDQLDEEAGSRERDWVNMLLRYLNGKGPHPSLFQVFEGAT